jgi:CDGSH-type Zn-finger protein
MVMENEKEDKRKAVEIYILENGPIVLKGFFRFTDSAGCVTEKEQEIELCRCGHSSNKPYCDDTHKKTGVRN